MNAAIIFWLVLASLMIALFVWGLWSDYKRTRQKRAFHKGLMTYDHGGTLKQTWRAIRDEQKRKRLDV